MTSILIVQLLYAAINSLRSVGAL